MSIEGTLLEERGPIGMFLEGKLYMRDTPDECIEHALSSAGPLLAEHQRGHIIDEAAAPRRCYELARAHGRP